MLQLIPPAASPFLLRLLLCCHPPPLAGGDESCIAQQVLCRRPIAQFLSKGDAARHPGLPCKFGYGNWLPHSAAPGRLLRHTANAIKFIIFLSAVSAYDLQIGYRHFRPKYIWPTNWRIKHVCTRRPIAYMTKQPMQNAFLLLLRSMNHDSSQ